MEPVRRALIADPVAGAPARLTERDLMAGLEQVAATFPPEVIDRGINRSWNHFAYLLRRLRPFLAELPPGARVCDIGAGAGVVPLALTRFGFRVSVADTWSDYSPELDNQMGTAPQFFDRFRQFGVAQYRVDVLEQAAPLADASQHLVSALGVIEHLTHPKRLVDEICRLLAPGGYAVITLPNSANLRNRIRMLLGRSPHPDDWRLFYSDAFCGHYRELTRDELRSVFASRGFDIRLLELTNHSQHNTRLPDGRWKRVWRPTSLRQIACGAYLGVVALVPTFRYDLLLVARKPAVASSAAAVGVPARPSRPAGACAKRPHLPCLLAV